MPGIPVIIHPLFQLSMLEKQGITHIVCVRQDIEANFIKPNFPHKFRYFDFFVLCTYASCTHYKGPLFLTANLLYFFVYRYLVLDIADNPVENIIRYFPMVSWRIFIHFMFIWCVWLFCLIMITCFSFYRLKNLLMDV